MLLGLGLGAALVGCNQQEGPVHEGGSREHGGHEGLVTGCVHEGHCPVELCLSTALGALLGRAVSGGAFAVRTLVEGDISVPEPDGDTSLDLLGVTVGPLAGKCLGEGGLSVVDVTDHPDVDLGLLGNFHSVFSSPPLRSSSMGLGPYSAMTMLI